MKKLLLPLLFIFPLQLDAQRATTYESLLQRSDQPNAYTSHIVIPKNDGSAFFGVTFRLDHDFIPFLRVRSGMNPDSENAQYFAPVRLGVEINEGHVRESRRSSRNTQGRSVYRSTYQDTVFVDTFEETKSRYEHAQGFLTTTLQPGEYHYNLQLTRGESVREQPSQKRNILVPEYATLDSAGFTLMAEMNISEQSAEGTLLNYGNSVLYGQDFDALFVLPQNSDQTYSLKMFRMRPGNSSDTESDPMYETTVEESDIFFGTNTTINKSGEELHLSMDKTDSGVKFAKVSVPNSQFPNARYKLILSTPNNPEVTERIINSQWLDMPVSLLNIDVAIDMMRFITDNDQLKEIRSGSGSQKEQKFREFWEERDPSPDTEYNELMTEYYSRIDQTYQRFTSPQQPGYETDQGQALILYGEPLNITRELPTNSPTQEIWEYRNRTLVFEATTGFGDFRLVEER
ncbi:MAG: GWxTD domain-containing protein [Balneolaceae bacterium]